MVRTLVVIGSGGFGREVLDIARDQRRERVCVVDDFPAQRNLELLARQGIPRFGTTDDMIADMNPDEVEYVIGIGDGVARKRLDAKLSAAGFEAATLVHSAASLGFDVVLSPGSVICAGARLTTNIVLGRHVHVNINATVGHDTVLEDYVTMNPTASVSGNVTVGESTLIGANAFVMQKLSIGAFSIVGASASVVKPVDPHTTVVGVPARPLHKKVAATEPETASSNAE